MEIKKNKVQINKQHSSNFRVLSHIVCFKLTKPSTKSEPERELAKNDLIPFAVYNNVDSKENPVPFLVFLSTKVISDPFLFPVLLHKNSHFSFLCSSGLGVFKTLQ